MKTIEQEKTELNNEVDYSDCMMKYIRSNSDMALIKASPYIALTILALGLLMLILCAVTDMSKVITVLLAIFAIIILFYGIFKLGFGKKRICYTPTGEILNRTIFYFSVAQLNDVKKMLETGSLSCLETMTSGNANLPIKVEMYATKSFSCAVAQLYLYRPFQYVAQQTIYIQAQKK